MRVNPDKLSAQTDALRKGYIFLDSVGVDVSKVHERSKVLQLSFIENGSEVPTFDKVYSYRKSVLQRLWRQGIARIESDQTELFGTTLRQQSRKHDGDEAKALIQQFGRCVAKLHAQGVLFRSLHFGNVLVTLEQDLALIDIVDISFRRSGALGKVRRVNAQWLSRSLASGCLQFDQCQGRLPHCWVHGACAA
jgi:hypothetical protein